MDEQNIVENETEIVEEEVKAPFVPSPRWKRVLAWVFFVVVVLGIITWLLNIAFPAWIADVKAWFAGLFS